MSSVEIGPGHHVYFGIVHPSVAEALFAAATPKELWKIAYRSQRLARRGILEPPNHHPKSATMKA